MTRRKLKLLSIAVIVLGLVVGGIIGCTPEEVAEEEPTTLSETADAIREGQIDVGNEYGLIFEQRYHEIHTTTLGLECASCHISQPDTTQTVFTAQDVSPQAPGPVDKRACLGCHGASGPAKNIYGSASP